MATVEKVTTAQIRQVLELREQIEALQAKLDAIRGGKVEAATPSTKKKVGRTKGKRTMSAETIEKMRAAQQARWAKIHGKTAAAKSSTKAAPKKKVMSPEAKAKIAAAMKARWATRKKASGA